MHPSTKVNLKFKFSFSWISPEIQERIYSTFLEKLKEDNLIGFISFFLSFLLFLFLFLFHFFFHFFIALGDYYDSIEFLRENNNMMGVNSQKKENPHARLISKFHDFLLMKITDSLQDMVKTLSETVFSIKSLSVINTSFLLFVFYRKRKIRSIRFK